MKFNGNIMDIENSIIIPARIEIENGIFTKVEPITDEKYCIDINGLIFPGLIDAHIHIESTMLTPSQFAKAVVPFGVTSVITDPHEIANVCGVEGINFMLEDAKSVPFDFNFTVPSCVPATSFETSGAILDSDIVGKLLASDDFIGLSEMMNVPGVLFEDEEVIAKINHAKKNNKFIDGHAPLLTGEDLEKYISYGIFSDHESSSLEEILEKRRLGMKILLRDGSFAKNLIHIFNKNYLLNHYTGEDLSIENFFKDYPFCDCVVSDDKHPDELLNGYLLNSFKRVVDQDFYFSDALKMFTQNPSDIYNLNAGRIEEGYKANFFIVDTFDNFKVKSTFINGVKVFDGENVLFDVKSSKKINVMDLDDKISDDFDLISDKDEVDVNVIGIIEHELITEKLEATLKTVDNVIQPDLDNDILKIAVVERYGGNNIANAFVKGFNLKKGAFASSVAHDSHNIVVVGTNSRDMARATNLIKENQGGFAFCEGTNENILPLPIAGLMTDKSAQEVAIAKKKIEEDVINCGCSIKEPFMALSFLSLLVIPSIKLSNKGLFDGDSFEFMSVIKD